MFNPQRETYFTTKKRFYNLRNLFLAITLSFIYIHLAAQQLPLFSINGKFNPYIFAGKIYLNYLVNGIDTKDSCQIKKGVFSFGEKLMQPAFGTLRYNNKTKVIFLEPRLIKVFCKDEQFEHFETSTSRSEIEFNEINNKISKIQNRWKSVIDTILAVNRRSNAAAQELKDWVLKPYFQEVRESYLDFFNKHPQSFVTAYFLSINIIEMNQGILPADSLKAYYDRFATPVKSSWYGERIIEELAKRKIAVPGTKANNFTGTDINGQSLSLSSFRGKYVLLDFWGCWCVPCRKGSPHLKELYFRYKEKGFDVVGIAADNDTKDAWRKAVEKDGLPWHNILIDDLEVKYNIRSYPTKILIDKQGIVIGRFGEEEKEVDEQLSSIFKDFH